MCGVDEIDFNPLTFLIMEKHEKIAKLNDTLRKEGQGGMIVETQGIQALSGDIRQQVYAAVRNFDSFSPDNDPHKEHDFAALSVAGKRVNWKVDYYDKTMTYLSEDPTDPSITKRVMTIMLAEEY
ncbi:conserved hypothetical protein [Candidatus Terasakiella magnetica]|uniref:DUF3768 domain-containing protein n=1 Tax=Candidatus Terasakiella magnetica TaxID=1867952 RepID=A0A1C3RHH3_9PROT|nr:DUF3768 domain-containing protein [Candidatus Terasakiella magnetica]SCA56725.1 conserved hypothetical protein [Candidatus Terasakiella magnetica]